MTMDWQVEGKNAVAPFTLKLHRGEGMVLIAMNWRQGEPPLDFVGFAVEYLPPDGDRFYAIKNRIAFPGRDKPSEDGAPPEQYPTTEAPLQSFRWIHFPRIANVHGLFTYRVTPMFMNAAGELSRGLAQEAQISLYAETLPGKINVAFTRGYVSSQSFVDRYGGAEGFKKLIPAKADEGNDFVSTHPKAKDAYAWMGFEARARIVGLLDAAIEDEAAEVMVVAYELNLPELIERLAKIGPRLRIILDDSGSGAKDKGLPHSAESRAPPVLAAAGAQVGRQNMGNLHPNKMIVVDGPTVQQVVLGSTNFSWRGFYVQANNALIVTGKAIVAQQRDAFEAYWNGTAASFAASGAATWRPLQVEGLDAEIAMSPHNAARSTQKSIGQAIDGAQSSLFYSLAFLSQTSGEVTDAILRATARSDLFVYGIANAPVGATEEMQLRQPDGNLASVSPAALTKGVPEPFHSEASGGGGIKMHHKFVVIDFNKPSARVYTGSYNFSYPADMQNGENLVVIRDPRFATSYMVEALRIFDAYQYRLAAKDQQEQGKRKELKIPPTDGALPWWKKFYTVPVKIRDRELFA